jgi:hypothetical protein
LDFANLIAESADFRRYSYYALSAVEAGIEKALLLKDGGIVYSIKIPQQLAEVFINPPTLDLEPEMIELEEDSETPSI